MGLNQLLEERAGLLEEAERFGESAGLSVDHPEILEGSCQVVEVLVVVGVSIGESRSMRRALR